MTIPKNSLNTVVNRAVSANGLGKFFEDFCAVESVSFEVKAGEIYGLLGPNGAGKTTTLRMLSGLLQPTSGSSSISGISMQQNTSAARKKLGFLTGEMGLYERLNPIELLNFFGKLYGVPSSQINERVDFLVETFQIGEFAGKLCGKLSTGQKQRVAIARTLIHNPDVIMLDEPTTGLDIMSAELVLRFIEKMAKQEGKAIIFSTHILSEVDRLCDRIGIIQKGKMLAEGTPESITTSQQTTNLSEAFFRLVTDQKPESQLQHSDFFNL